MITHFSNRKPYIGLSGIKHRDDLLAVFDELPECPSRVFAIGYLVTEATLRGEKKANQPERYPSPEEIAVMASLSGGDDRVQHVLHYCAKPTAKNEADLVTRCASAMQRVQGMNGIQINTPEPLPSNFGMLSRFVPTTDLRVIAQLDPTVINSTGDVDRALGAFVPQGAVSDVLLDFSKGTGREIDVERAGRVIDFIHSRYGVKLGIGVAGGIHPEHTKHLSPLLADYPALSFDVESGARDHDDLFDVDRALYVITELAELVQARG